MPLSVVCRKIRRCVHGEVPSHVHTRGFLVLAATEDGEEGEKEDVTTPPRSGTPQHSNAATPRRSARRPAKVCACSFVNRFRALQVSLWSSEVSVTPFCARH